MNAVTRTPAAPRTLSQQQADWHARYMVKLADNARKAAR